MKQENNENRIADRLIQSLESKSIDDPVENDTCTAASAQLAELLRESVDVDENSVRPNPDLRTAMIQAIESSTPAPPIKTSSGSTRNSSHFFKLLIAVSAMLMLVCGIWYFNEFSAEQRNVANLPATEPFQRSSDLYSADLDSGKDELDSFAVIESNARAPRLGSDAQGLKRVEPVNLANKSSEARSDDAVNNGPVDADSKSGLHGNEATSLQRIGRNEFEYESKKPANHAEAIADHSQFLLEIEKRKLAQLKDVEQEKLSKDEFVPPKKKGVGSEKLIKLRSENKARFDSQGRQKAPKDLVDHLAFGVVPAQTSGQPAQTQGGQQKNGVAFENQTTWMASGVSKPAQGNSSSGTKLDESNSDFMLSRGSGSTDLALLTTVESSEASKQPSRLVMAGEHLDRGGRAADRRSQGFYFEDKSEEDRPDDKDFDSNGARRKRYEQLSLAKHDDRFGREYYRFRRDSRFANEQYEPIIENPFQVTQGPTAISTFSIDVDTASYANLRRFLQSGHRPPAGAVRIEELINYFDYDYPQPKNGHPFSVNMEVASCPWNKQHKLLRVGLQGEDIHRDERPASNLVFLIDVSGSMSDANKLPLLKQGFDMMVGKLTENDRVTIVTYAGNAGVALETTGGEKTKVLREAIQKLKSGGSTHGSAGIKLAYELAQKHFIEGGVNKVLLATDGDLNVGVTRDDDLVKLIKSKASEGVFLTVLGFGTGNLKDAKLEKIADNGNGVYAYIDTVREAHKVLVEEMSSSLVTIAKDVKIQIEFNPAEVQSYRLIGYENRKLKTQDFHNDTVDAGEIGAGHSVTAIYELITTNAVEQQVLASPQKLKYQTDEPAKKPSEVKRDVSGLTEAAKTGELLTLSLRYKKPEASESELMEFVVKNDEKSFESASEDFRFAAGVAAFGMIARGSKHAGDSSIRMVQNIVVDTLTNDRSGYRAEFLELVRKFQNCGR